RAVGKEEGVWQRPERQKAKGRQASALDKGSGRDQWTTTARRMTDRAERDRRWREQLENKRNPFCGLYHTIPYFTDTFLYQWKSLGFQDQESGTQHPRPTGQAYAVHSRLKTRIGATTQGDRR
ncbi:uncharacterized protein CLUP02_02251, partial [Colletotrichum lupini]